MLHHDITSQDTMKEKVLSDQILFSNEFPNEVTGTLAGCQMPHLFFLSPMGVPRTCVKGCAWGDWNLRQLSPPTTEKQRVHCSSSEVTLRGQLTP